MSVQPKSLSCPICNQSMTLVRLSTSAYHECRSHGIWMWISFILGFQSGREIINEIYIARRFPRISEKKLLTCPRCKNHMTPTPYPRVNHVTVDQCYNCNAIWFDTPELSQISEKGELEKNFSSRGVESQKHEGETKMRLHWPSRADLTAEPQFSALGMLGMLGKEEANPGRATKPLTTLFMICLFFCSTALAMKSSNFFLNSVFYPGLPWRFNGFTLLTSAFVHLGWFHLISNAYFFYFCGENIEESDGSLFLMVLFFLSAVFGNLFYLKWGGQAPTAGASGGIMGMFVYYSLRFPKNRVKIFFATRFLKYAEYRMSSGVFLIYFFVIQFLGFIQQGATQGLAINYLAHLGGALTGLTFFVYREMTSIDLK